MSDAHNEAREMTSSHCLDWYLKGSMYQLPVIFTHCGTAQEHVRQPYSHARCLLCKFLAWAAAGYSLRWTILRNTGSVYPNLHDVDGRTQCAFKSAQEDAIHRLVEESLELSTPALAREMNVSSSTVHRLLRSDGLYPYLYRIVLGLPPDEARFTCDTVFNSHNSHMWSGSNPHAIRPQRHQDRWSANVRADMLGN
ncbi:DUF4817 domain-containing protein [Caerostris darwini]|uniref:DUF4817 domain-containing protein n=1 Tax=Caerostris darwini TaxID=1538125 RepID=A0AAV4SR19_9ARAC|nr:DUF4817 domain-containing protein [Caerostris darwini]